MDNKKRFFNWARAAMIILWGSIAAGTTVSVWNAAVGAAPGTFHCIIAGLNVITNGFGIYLALKKFKPEE
jgi:hypothetical protein